MDFQNRMPRLAFPAAAINNFPAARVMRRGGMIPGAVMSVVPDGGVHAGAVFPRPVEN